MKIRKMCVLAAAMMFLSATACDAVSQDYIKMTPEDSFAYESDVLGENVLPVISFTSPWLGSAGQANTLTDEMMKITKDGGVNAIMGHSIAVGSQQESTLAALCSKYDLGYIACTGASGYWSINETKDGFHLYEDYSLEKQVEVDAAFKTKLQALTEYDCFMGVRFTDEDGYRLFKAAGAAKKVFDEVCPDKVFSHNLISTMGSLRGLDYGYSENYLVSNLPISSGIASGGAEFYYESEVDLVNPTIMSYDGYPFTMYGKVVGNFHNNQKLINDIARERQKSTWGYPQAFGLNELPSSHRVPHYNEIEYQIGVLLGMGAKGLVLYCYFTPPETATTGGDYPIDIQGNRTQMYYDYQAALSNMRVYQHVLMDSVTKAVMVGGISDFVAQRPPEEMVVEQFNELVSVSSHETGVVAYCMNYQGKTAIYVQNADITKGAVADITLAFSRKVKTTVYQNGQERIENGQYLNLKDVPAGVATMVVIG